MTRKKALHSLTPILVAALAPACALTAPARNSGPAVSREGVQLAVVKQRCEQLREPDQSDDLAEVVLEIQVHNPTREAATIRPTDFRLIGDERFALKTSTWEAIHPITVDAGTDRTFDLRFMARGAVECAKEMRLDPGAGVLTKDQPLKLEPVRFVPWRV
jgi:hypothetical protein